MTKVAMARLLKRFGIKPKMMRIGGESVRGYDRDWFEDAFARYIPCSTATPATPPENPRVSPDADRNKPDAMLRSEKDETPAKTGHVAGVAVQPRGAVSEAVLERDFGQMSFLRGDTA